MTVLTVPADMSADVAMWAAIPELIPPGLDLLELRWALARIDGASAEERRCWFAAAGPCDCPCAVVAGYLVKTLIVALGERDAGEYLKSWAAAGAHL